MIDERSPLFAAAFGIGFARAIGLHVGLTEADSTCEAGPCGDFHVHLNSRGVFVLPCRAFTADLYQWLFPSGAWMSEGIEPTLNALRIARSPHQIPSQDRRACPGCGYRLFYRCQPYPTKNPLWFLQYSLVLHVRPHRCLPRDPSTRLGPNVLRPNAFGPDRSRAVLPDYHALACQLIGTGTSEITYQIIRDFLAELGWLADHSEAESPHIVALIDAVLRQRFP